MKVGSVSTALLIEAMSIATDDNVDGGLIFDRSIPLTMRNHQVRQVTHNEVDMCWLRTEFLPVADNSDNTPKPGDALFLSCTPYTTFWVHHIPFRKGNRKAFGLPTPGVAPDREALGEWFAQRNFDYWLTGDGPFAALADYNSPAALFPSEQPGREIIKLVVGILPANLVNRPAPKSQGQWRDPTRANETTDHTLITKLYNSERVQGLLRKTERGTLRITYDGNGLSSVPDHVRAEANSLMLVAIRQCLAGPYKNEHSYIGHPVTKLLAQIFTDLVAAVSRRSADALAHQLNNLDDLDSIILADTVDLTSDDGD
ncbi:MAG: hypothetical protein ACPGOY_13425 [Rhodospirillaceae bacterium]